MAFVDYYKILGVDKNIPQKDVRAAYRKRAKQFHPDLHPNDPKAKAKFQALNEAYDVISDPDKRAKYDPNSGRMRRLMNRLAMDLEASAAVVLVAAIRLRASISVISVREAAVLAASSKISSVVVAVALVVLEVLVGSVALAETLGQISVLVVATADVVVMPVIVLVR